MFAGPAARPGQPAGRARRARSWSAAPTPAPAVLAVVDGWLEAAEDAAGFARRWRVAVRRAPPEPVDDPAAFGAAVARLAGDGPADDELRRLAAAWFMLGRWTMALTTFLQRSAVRTTLPRREEVEDAVESLQDVRYDLDWLVDLLRVLDDEQIVVLHRPSGRGWALTVGGIGDNFQLHTLLAATLSARPTTGCCRAAAVGRRGRRRDRRPAAPGGRAAGALPPRGRRGALDLERGRPGGHPCRGRRPRGRARPARGEPAPGRPGGSSRRWCRRSG